MKQLKHIISVLLLTLCCNAIMAQDAAQDGGEQEYVLTAQQIEQISEDISNYTSELNNLVVTISGARKMSSIKSLESSLMSINVRWQAYYSLEQKDISLNEQLTQLSVTYQQLYQVVSDSIGKQKDIVCANDNFTAADRFIRESRGRYDTFLADATKWSLTSKTAKQLEAVKAEEQLFFQKIDKQYQDAQAAAALDPKLATRMAELEKVYIDVKGDSETVQAAAYQPLLIRIKDYILSIAGVAIIILFLTMLQSKLASIKAAHKAAKDAKKQLMMANKDIPEI